MVIPNRASFWRIVIHAFQVGLSTVQGVTLSSEDEVRNFNIIIAIAQGILAVAAILTQDNNQNDVIDVAENSKVDVTVSSPKNVDVTVTKETKDETN